MRDVFLNVAMYQEIGVKPHYCINIGLQGYFESSILSCSLIISMIQASVIYIEPLELLKLDLQDNFMLQKSQLKF